MSHPVNSAPTDKLSQVGHLSAPGGRDTDADALLKPGPDGPLPGRAIQPVIKTLFKKAPEISLCPSLSKRQLRLERGCPGDLMVAVRG
jgi:hypothetical protein